MTRKNSTPVSDTIYHIQVHIRANKNTYSWSDPSGRVDFEVDVPAAFYSPEALSALVDAWIAKADADLEKNILVKAEEDAAKEAEEQANLLEAERRGTLVLEV